jgi:radical SAM protein with 4Fe4S-binding SPASM domain
MSRSNPFVLSAPIYYSLELTPFCNSHCSSCGNVFERRGAPLAAEGWLQVLARIAPHAESIKITGGEPTLHPAFEQIVRAVAELGVKFTIFTNGRWQVPEKLLGFLATLPREQFGLLISLHGPDAATHETFTQTPGSFEETCANIRRAAGAELRVHTSTIIMRQNYNRLSEMVALAKTLQAERAVFNRYLGPPMPAIEPDERQLRQAMRAIESLQKSGENVRYGNCIPQCFAPSSSTGCWAGVAYCTIDPWGNVRPCNHSSTLAGNILREPLEAIWQSETMNHWRALTPKQCRGCSQLDVCHGGCRALVEIRESDPLIKEPVKIAKPPLELELYQHSRPALHCKVQREGFGFALIRGQSMEFLDPQAGALLDYLDGQHTLAQLQLALGQDALDLVGSLYLKSLVSLEQT